MLALDTHDAAVAAIPGAGTGRRVVPAVWFDSWADLVRILVVGPVAYVGLVLLLRTSGARTLSKLNAFDLVITVALGSTLATVLLTTDVSIAEGVLGIAVLVLMQLVVTWSSRRWRAVERLVKSDPVLVYHRGFQHGAMGRARVTQDEVRQAARGAGHPSLDDVVAVVLETDGTFSILTSVPQLPDRRG